MSRSRLRRFSAWLADAVRFAGALVYWNARKTAYRARGASGRCPCQNHSDDSVPYHVRCNAAANWNEPARFRRVCPLLAETRDGWRCSVHATQVRPFWARAAAFLLAGAGVAYALVTLLVFGALNVFTGAKPSWWQIASPLRWSEVRTGQADYLYDRAMQAFARGSLNEAHLALISATQRDPRNYEASLLLAQITMFQGSALHADQMFASLSAQHPAEAYRTAVAYHDTLLSLGRTDRLAEHCLAMAINDSAHAALWVRSLLLSLRNDSVTAAALATKQRGAIGSLAPFAQLLVRAEIEWQGGNRNAAIEQLRQPFRGPLNPLYMQLQCERLAEFGDHTGAQALLDFYGPILGDVPHAFAQFTLDQHAKDTWAARVLFRRLLTGPFDAKRVEQFAVALVKAPDAELYAEFSAKVRSLPALAADVASTMWLVGIVCGDVPNAEAWQRVSPAAPPQLFPRVRHIEFASRDLQDPQSAVQIINVLPLPREVIVALLARVDRAAPSKRTLRLNVGE